MGWVGPALGIASSLLGSHNQSQAAMLPFKLAKQHYKQGKQRISDRSYQQAFNMFAPGFMQGGQSPVGGALVQQALNLLQNPGQIGPEHRERIVEAQNRAMNMMRFMVPGAAAEAGVATDFNNPTGGAGVPGAMLTSGMMNAQAQTNDALRQLAMMQEGLRRQDIGMGQNIYSALLAPILQKQLTEAQTLINAPIPGINPQYAGGAAGGLGNMFGALLGSSMQKEGAANPFVSWLTGTK